MARTYAVVDLFAGPGGLSEGFAACRLADGTPAFDVLLSVEKDPAAWRTLRLRSFLRLLDRLPRAYLAWIADPGRTPEWEETHPRAWEEAGRRTLRRELGAPGVFEELAPRLVALREAWHGDTVLIGGPPCQAYSLIGRARNAGNPGYDPERDGRHFLYREYLRILDLLRPAAFVMENVKGLLSARVGREHVFRRILDDLASIGGGSDAYELVAFAGGRVGCTDVREFVVRAEEFGVPQARHRVFVLGIRRDALPVLLPPPPRVARPVAAGTVLAGLEPLRSGLSRGDSADAWRRTVLDAFGRLERLARKVGPDPDSFAERLRAWRERFEAAAPAARTGRLPPAATGMDDALRRWIAREDLPRAPDHETRGHMQADLARYLFCAVFADAFGRSPDARDFPPDLAPDHRSWSEGKFADRFRVQLRDRPASTVTSHIAKDGHYYIHPDPVQCRSLTVREAARLQTFPDDYAFLGSRTERYVQVGNAVPPLLAHRLAQWLLAVLETGRSATADAWARAARAG